MALKELIKRSGATQANSLTKKCTHLISFSGNTQKHVLFPKRTRCKSAESGRVQLLGVSRVVCRVRGARCQLRRRVSSRRASSSCSESVDHLSVASCSCSASVAWCAESCRISVHDVSLVLLCLSALCAVTASTGVSRHQVVCRVASCVSSRRASSRCSVSVGLCARRVSRVSFSFSDSMDDVFFRPVLTRRVFFLF